MFKCQQLDPHCFLSDSKYTIITGILHVNWINMVQGRIQISKKGVNMYKGVGVRFVDFYRIFL